MSHPPPPNLGPNGALRSDASMDADHPMSIQGVGTSPNGGASYPHQAGGSGAPYASSGGFNTVKLCKIVACEIKVCVMYAFVFADVCACELRDQGMHDVCFCFRRSLCFRSV
jgi:hypothetical protein